MITLNLMRIESQTQKTQKIEIIKTTENEIIKKIEYKLKLNLPYDLKNRVDNNDTIEQEYYITLILEKGSKLLKVEISMRNRTIEQRTRILFETNNPSNINESIIRNNKKGYFLKGIYRVERKRME